MCENWRERSSCPACCAPPPCERSARERSRRGRCDRESGRPAVVGPLVAALGRSRWCERLDESARPSARPSSCGSCAARSSPPPPRRRARRPSTPRAGRRVPHQPVEKRAVRRLCVLAGRAVELELEPFAPLDELHDLAQPPELVAELRHQRKRLLVVGPHPPPGAALARAEGDARRVGVLRVGRRPQRANERLREVLAPLDPPGVHRLRHRHVGHHRRQRLLQLRQLRQHVVLDRLLERVDDTLHRVLADGIAAVALLAGVQLLEEAEAGRVDVPVDAVRVGCARRTRGTAEALSHRGRHDGSSVWRLRAAAWGAGRWRTVGVGN